MKGTSKVIMGATLVMVVILAIVLGLVLVLLAELYCSLLLRRRRKLRTPTSNTTTTTTTTTSAVAIESSSQPQQLEDRTASSQPLRSFYAHGVLRAPPRSCLFPAVHGKEDKVVEIEKQHSQFHRFFESETEEPNTTPHRLGVVSTSPPSPSFISVSSPKPIEKVTTTLEDGNISGCNGGACGGGGREHFVYISNPIYDNDAGGPSRIDTPFETPDTSPSRLETGGSSGENSTDHSSPSSPSSLPNTPPLTPMKKLPAEACSVSLRDSRSLPTSGSDSNSNNGLSSSSSGSPCTSPSW